MKAFLLAFDHSRVTRDMAIRCVDTMDAVANWYAVFDNTIIIASHSTSQELSAEIRHRFPDLKFIVSEVDAQHKAGWLPRPVWNFLNEPRSATAESA